MRLTESSHVPVRQPESINRATVSRACRPMHYAKNATGCNGACAISPCVPHRGTPLNPACSKHSGSYPRSHERRSPTARVRLLAVRRPKASHADRPRALVQRPPSAIHRMRLFLDHRPYGSRVRTPSQTHGRGVARRPQTVGDEGRRKNPKHLRIAPDRKGNEGWRIATPWGGADYTPQTAINRGGRKEEASRAPCTGTVRYRSSHPVGPETEEEDRRLPSA